MRNTLANYYTFRRSASRLNPKYLEDLETHADALAETLERCLEESSPLLDLLKRMEAFETSSG